jgi:PrtD family type I secretion system ABC transporter
VRSVNSSIGNKASGENPLFQVMTQLRRHIVTMLGLSGAINVLGITISLYTIQVFDRVLSSRSLDSLLFLSIAAVIALCAASVLDGIRSLALGRLGEWSMRRLAPDVLARSIERRLVDGNLRTEMLREVSQLRGFISGPGVPAMLDVPWMPFYLLVAFLIHPVIGVVALAGMAVLFGLAFYNEKFNSAGMRTAAAVSSLVLRDSDAIMRNAEVIDSMGMTPQITSRWSRRMMQELRLQDEVQRRSAILVSSSRLARSLMQILLYGVAAILVLQQQMTGGAMMAGAIIVSRLLAPMESMFVHWRSLMLIREIYSHLDSFFRLPGLRATQTELPPPAGQVTVDRVTLVVPGHPAPILRSVQFAVQAGEHLAIAGLAASGKTTLVRVVLGILRPAQGAARLDGMDVSRWNREDLGRHLGYLPQDVELFSGTVAENIARFTACEDAEIIRAAQMAGCHKLILGLPSGYDTEIGEGGLLLSGGQRQQIGLARALFGRPRLVVLDEPNSNLDSQGDMALRRALQRLHDLRVTAIIVTHRQSILGQVDKLLFMQEGMVKYFGPVEEVLRRMREEPKLGNGDRSSSAVRETPPLAETPEADASSPDEVAA